MRILLLFLLEFLVRGLYIIIYKSLRANGRNIGKPGMPRDDLFNINAGIVKGLIEVIAEVAPKAYEEFQQE